MQQQAHLDIQAQSFSIALLPISTPFARSQKPKHTTSWMLSCYIITGRPPQIYPLRSKKDGKRLVLHCVWVDLFRALKQDLVKLRWRPCQRPCQRPRQYFGQHQVVSFVQRQSPFPCDVTISASRKLRGWLTAKSI
jgi:hypothetical protein